MTTLVELSHRIHDGDIGYPGLPAPRIRPHLTHAASAGGYSDGATFEITHLSLVGNTGTYLDSPAHRFPGRTDVADVPLAQLVDLPALVVDVGVSEPGPVELRVTADMAGAAVLVRTGWDARRGTDTYFEPAPYLSCRAAEELAAVRPALVGVDVWNVDDTRHTARPVHTVLLDAGVVIVEHLRALGDLPPSGARFSAVPLAVVGAASMPVRAWGVVPDRRDDT
jgi:arylformamidase